MNDHSLTILSLETLASMKLDAIALLSNPYRTRDAVIEAREVIDAVNRECNRRMDWADAARAALAATV